LTCVSRLAPEKGFEFLAEAVKRLDARGFKFHMLIVGGNKNPQVVQEIKDMFGHLNDEGTSCPRTVPCTLTQELPTSLR
jgi:glycosyltransferase involved in cell wall biosynthesis